MHVFPTFRHSVLFANVFIFSCFSEFFSLNVLFTKRQAKTFYYDHDLLNFYYKYQILDVCVLTLCNFISLYLRILHFLLSMYHYMVTVFNCFCCSVAQSRPTL